MTPRDTRTLPQFPGAVGFTHLCVYDSAAPDGMIGGSPHVHLASAEAYVTQVGHGQVQTLGPDGFQLFDLRPGAVVWFEPGVIHRLVNTSGDLEILCVMQNAGLPEAGDAVLTFPDHVLADPAAYERAVGVSGPEPLSSAWQRRDLAVEGFSEMFNAGAEGRPERYRQFLQRAVALRQSRIPEWRRLWQERPLAEVQRTGQRLDEIEAGSTDALTRAGVASFMPQTDEPGYGMCGRLDTYLPEGWAT